MLTGSTVVSFSFSLSGGSTYDDLATEVNLPNRIKRLVFKSTSTSTALNLKLGGSSQILTLTPGDIYDSNWCDWQNVDVKINGTGSVDGEYWI